MPSRLNAFSTELDVLSCFVIGPMRIDENGVNHLERLNKLAKEIVKPVLSKWRYNVFVPGSEGTGTITNNIIMNLDHSELVVANVTGNNPNVMYEVGIRHCMGLPCILVTEDTVPFDISGELYHKIDIDDVEGSREKLKEALEGAHDMIANEKLFSNPVTNYYQAPLTEVSPAAGLALGYVYNFAQNVIDKSLKKIHGTEEYEYSLTLSEKKPKRGEAADGEEIDGYNRENVTLEIVVPTNLTYASHNFITRVVRSGHLKHATLQAPGRDFPLYARPSTAGGVKLIDVPTAMNVMDVTVSQRSAELRLDRGSLEWLTIERQETIRFVSAVKRYIRNHRDAIIRERIRIVEWDVDPDNPLEYFPGYEESIDAFS